VTRLILASASPRRRELLAALTESFEVAPSGIDEPLAGSAVENAVALAAAKARDVLASKPDAVVIGADTIVFLDGVSYGKPEDEDDVLRMWRELRGRPHGVVTGIAVAASGGVATGAVVSQVTLTNLADDEIRRYAESGRPMDKAGAYAIQDEDLPTVSRLDGCYCNVMGLPLWSLRRLLLDAGIAAREPSGRFARCATCPDRQSSCYSP